MTEFSSSNNSVARFRVSYRFVKRASSRSTSWIRNKSCRTLPRSNSRADLSPGEICGKWRKGLAATRGLEEMDNGFRACARYSFAMTRLLVFQNTSVEGLSFGQSAGLKDDLDVDDNDVGEKKRQAFLDLLMEAGQNGSVLTPDEVREQVDTIMFEVGVADRYYEYYVALKRIAQSLVTH